MPTGYTLYEEHDNYILVYITDLLLSLDYSPMLIEHNDNLYEREMIQIMPPELIGTACIMRKYILK